MLPALLWRFRGAVGLSGQTHCHQSHLVYRRTTRSKSEHFSHTGRVSSHLTFLERHVRHPRREREYFFLRLRLLPVPVPVADPDAPEPCTVPFSCMVEAGVTPLDPLIEKDLLMPDIPVMPFAEAEIKDIRGDAPPCTDRGGAGSLKPRDRFVASSLQLMSSLYASFSTSKASRPSCMLFIPVH